MVFLATFRGCVDANDFCTVELWHDGGSTFNNTCEICTVCDTEMCNDQGLEIKALRVEVQEESTPKMDVVEEQSTVKTDEEKPNGEDDTGHFDQFINTLFFNSFAHIVKLKFPY
jgi:hypothetical protein